jgi:sensor histidine kinase YesM
MRDLPKLLLINVGTGSAFVFFYYAIASEFHWDAAARFFTVAFVFATITGGLAWYVLPKVAPLCKGPQPLIWLQIIGLLAAMGFVGGTLSYWILHQNPWLSITLDYWTSLSINLCITLGIGVVATLSAIARRRLEETTDQLRIRELEREKALKSAAEARLNSLESRVHPHFLFNTLNSIASLIRSNPALAEQLVERLSALLRYSLDRHTSLVPLKEELAITRDYLEIEKARFGDRLHFAVLVPEEFESVLVPALSLQTVVENSVKYAVGASRSGAVIAIEGKKTPGGILLEVRDNGPGFTIDTLPAGHGLDMLRQRLEAFFGQAASLRTQVLEPGVAVRIEVPC